MTTEESAEKQQLVLGLSKGEWYATAVFYIRLIIFVGTIAIVLVILEHSEYTSEFSAVRLPQHLYTYTQEFHIFVCVLVINELKDIIGYALALGTSIYLKLYQPLWYENLKW